MWVRSFGAVPSGPGCRRWWIVADNSAGLSAVDAVIACGPFEDSWES